MPYEDGANALPRKMAQMRSQEDSANALLGRWRKCASRKMAQKMAHLGRWRKRWRNQKMAQKMAHPRRWRKRWRNQKMAQKIAHLGRWRTEEDSVQEDGAPAL